MSRPYIIGGPDLYAWTGITPQPAISGIDILVEDEATKPVLAGGGSKAGSSFTLTSPNGRPQLEEEWASVKPGTFEIRPENSSAELEGHFLIGPAVRDENNQVCLLATLYCSSGKWTGETPIQISATMKFYVSNRDDPMRTFLDKDEVTKGAAVVDFSDGPGKGTSAATVVQDNSGGFAVQYRSVH